MKEFHRIDIPLPTKGTNSWWTVGCRTITDDPHLGQLPGGVEGVVVRTIPGSDGAEGGIGGGGCDGGEGAETGGYLLAVAGGGVGVPPLLVVGDVLDGNEFFLVGQTVVLG